MTDPAASIVSYLDAGSRRRHAPLLMGDELALDGSVAADGAISVMTVRKGLQKLADADAIRIRLTSTGGEAREALLIFNLLRSQLKPVHIVIEQAASCATAIACAGTKIAIVEGAEFAFHPPYVENGFLSQRTYRASDLRLIADVLDETFEQLVDCYQWRTQQDRSELARLVLESRRLTAQAAVSMGFADEVLPAPVQGDPCPALRCPARQGRRA